MKNQKMVEEFHRAFGHFVSDEVCLPPLEDFFNRLNWTVKEMKELVDAYTMKDTVEFADALGDILYFVYGYGVECGIDLDAVFEAVHRSNMTKLGENGKPIFYGDGKIAKGPNFKPPTEDIKKVLNL